jgi:hypothetical protein
MSSLIAGDLFVGRTVFINKVRHRIASVDHRSPTVILTVDDGSDQVVPMPRAELYAVLCEETATLEDPAEDPATTSAMPVVIMSFLEPAGQIDWYHKMVLMRHLIPYARCSPRARTFLDAHRSAVGILQWLRRASRVSSDKTWSAKTLNDVLRRWRRAGGSLAALLVQAVPARRKLASSPEIIREKNLVYRTTFTHPFASAASVHRVLRHRYTVMQQQSPTQERQADE